MGCKGLCINMPRASRSLTNKGIYSNGNKRCQVCERFIKWDGINCPCCGMRMRAGPRSSKYKEKARDNKK